MLSGFSKTRLGSGYKRLQFQNCMVMRAKPALLKHSCHSIRCTGFLGSIPSIQFPECLVNSVAGSPDGLCLPSPAGRFLLR